MNISNLVSNPNLFYAIYKALILILLLAMIVFGIQWYMSSLELQHTKELLNLK